MMNRRIVRASGLRRAALAGLVTALFAGTAQAQADERIIAAPFSSGYLNPNVSIDPGEPVTFFNPDFSAPHDVTSVDPGLFKSETVNAPAEVPVVGAESLAPGSYRFLCSVHTYMEGTITVGASGGGGADEKAPRMSARVVDDRIADALDAGALHVRVKLDEPATVRAVATAGRRETKVAKGRAKLDAGTAKLAARLTGRGKRLLRRADKVRLELALSAKDAAGNARKDTASATLR
jgi:plastocyanin